MTEKQRQAARKNIKKAQARWKAMSQREHSRSQPEGQSHRKPGSTGKGNYYRIEVRPKQEFTTFRTQDVGDQGHVPRVAGKRSSGSWATSTWLISKEDAHVEGGKLVADSKDARDLLDRLGSTPAHLTGDRFKAKDRRNIPEQSKPTAAQTNARSQNIKKAQSARQKKS